jgi:hypothetical protein
VPLFLCNVSRAKKARLFLSTASAFYEKPRAFAVSCNAVRFSQNQKDFRKKSQKFTASLSDSHEQRVSLTTPSTRSCRGEVMPRYFFHLIDDGQVWVDDQGVQLKELSTAHEYALKLQRKIREYSAEGPSSLMIKVADDAGQTPLIILPEPQTMDATSFGRVQ